MGYQVIKQPDGLLAIWASSVDDFIYTDAEPQEVVEWFVERARDDAYVNATKTVTAVVNNDPRSIYAQFAMTWDEALERYAYVHRQWEEDEEDDK